MTLTDPNEVLSVQENGIVALFQGMKEGSDCAIYNAQPTDETCDHSCCFVVSLINYPQGDSDYVGLLGTSDATDNLMYDEKESNQLGLSAGLVADADTHIISLEFRNHALPTFLPMYSPITFGRWYKAVLHKSQVTDSEYCVTLYESDISEYEESPSSTWSEVTELCLPYANEHDCQIFETLFAKSSATDPSTMMMSGYMRCLSASCEASAPTAE